MAFWAVWPDIKFIKTDGHFTRNATHITHKEGNIIFFDFG